MIRKVIFIVAISLVMFGAFFFYSFGRKFWRRQSNRVIDWYEGKSRPKWEGK